ncbi:hypothetical protein GCK32_013521 [Trichostrongylus colubriformis]|uniref:Poly(A) RNA polymerase mitochondrial-like central palm domain-containing protein n=1 Tax=Trichostrongylus colubriformis TaxID=6319 RepID=A0AAN8FXH2_TRICO
MKLAWPLCATKVHPSRCIPSSTSFDFQFSDGFIQKHRKRLKRWESGLIKAQQQRRYEFCKSYPNTIWYLSKLQKLFSRSGQTVVPIGSSVNGLKTQDSDLDLVLITHQDDARRAEFTKKFANVQSFRKAQMDRVARILNDPKLVQAGSVQQLVFCNVPIVKFRGRDGTSVDLQFNNIGSIRSTLFVRTCVEWSVAVPIVIHWMNSFFDSVKLKNSRNGLFSSYHLNMLVLHFLQSSALSFCPDVFTRYPQLDPSFSWHGVVRLLTAEIADAPYIHADAVQDISAAETIVKMIDYYSQLDLQNIAVSIDGKICKR